MSRSGQKVSYKSFNTGPSRMIVLPGGVATRVYGNGDAITQTCRALAAQKR